MSDRERWIVYPLLLFALVLAVAPKKDPKLIHTRELECEEITVADASGKKVRIGCAVRPDGNTHVADAGVMIVYGPNEKRILTLGPSQSDAGQLVVFNPEDESYCLLSSHGVTPMAGKPKPKPTDPLPLAPEKNENTPTEPAAGP